MAEPTKSKKKDEDEVTLAKSIFDEIVEATENEDAECEDKPEANKTDKPTELSLLP